MRKHILLCLALALVFFTCEQRDDGVSPIYNAPDIIPVNASAFIEVTDPLGNPVAGAVVLMDQKQFTTDENGLVLMRNNDMFSETYITVEKAGYFQGSRRFYPVEGMTHKVSIQLLPAQSIGAIQSTIGGNVNVALDVALKFPANAIATSDGSSYGGSVEVFAQFIAADDPALSEKMPGDLTGVSEEGQRGVLASFGMVAVELRSPSGELLNVQDGRTVEMRLRVPDEMLGKAPTTIPMWYFDEIKGMWIEEGDAALEGKFYVAHVPHFSFWNCDVDWAFVEWGASFRYSTGDGTLASGVTICLTEERFGTTVCSETSQSGYVKGRVPKNTRLHLEVRNPCRETVHSEDLGMFEASMTTGHYTIPEGSYRAGMISGKVVECMGEPVTSGFVRIRSGSQNYYRDLLRDGSFNTIVMNCGGPFVITGVDEANLKETVSHTIAYEEIVNTGTLTTCSDVTEYVRLEFEGFEEKPITFIPEVNGAETDSLLRVYKYQTGENFIYFSMVLPARLGPFGNIGPVAVRLPSGENASMVGTATGQVTYCGSRGDYIQGAIEGTVNTIPGGQNGTDYKFTGYFSLIRP